MTHVIEAEGLTKRFGTTQALAGVDIAAPAGRVLALLGPNGAGKTNPGLWPNCYGNRRP